MLLLVCMWLLRHVPFYSVRGWAQALAERSSAIDDNREELATAVEHLSQLKAEHGRIELAERKLRAEYKEQRAVRAYVRACVRA